MSAPQPEASGQRGSNKSWMPNAILLVMLDSNAFDPIVDNSSAYTLVQGAVASGRLTIMSTHVQVDELDRLLTRAGAG